MAARHFVHSVRCRCAGWYCGPFYVQGLMGCLLVRFTLGLVPGKDADVPPRVR